MKKRFILGLSVAAVCLLFSISSASAMTLTASPNPATINKAITFSIGIQVTSNPTSCNARVNYGDGSPIENLTFMGSETIQTSHTYSQAGSYAANVQVSDCNMDIVAPNPVFLNVRVADFEIKRIELLFDNNKPQVTLQRNEPAPTLTALVNYSGTEFVRGYWEIDGRKQHAFSRQLSIGPQAVFEYPKIPGIKTFQQGSHVIRFVITHPTLDITFPRAVYYVTPEKYLKVNDIRILSLNAEEETTAGRSITWQSVPLTEIYMVYVFADHSEDPVFSAYSRKNSYHFKPEALEKIRQEQGPYYIQIQGFHEDTRTTGQSKKEPIRLTK